MHVLVFVVAVCLIGHVVGDIATLQLAYGQQATSLTSTTASITCATGFTSVGVASAAYEYVDSTWSSTENTYLDVWCVSTCGQSFDTGYGSCATYSLTTGRNYNYCKEDSVEVSTTCNGLACTVHQFPYHQCSECGLCGNYASATPVPIPVQPGRVLGSSRSYAGCAIYDDSVVSCSTGGATEVFNSRRCGYETHSIDPAVYWDFCPRTEDNQCQDMIFTWTDTGGRNCRDYGATVCTGRSNKQSSDSAGFTSGDSFASYSTVIGVDEYDASMVCCMCGGGTQKCVEKDVPVAYKLPYVYDYRTCDGLQVSSTCSVTCLGETAATTVSCLRDTDYTQQAYLDTTQFPTGCPTAHQSWGLLYDSAGAQNGENLACSGTAAATATGSTWKDCVQAASQNCRYAVTWDYLSQTCHFYDHDQCQGFVTNNHHYTFTFDGPAPGFAPTLTQCTFNSDTDGSTTTYSVELTFSDNDNCHDNSNTGYDWLLNTAWASADGTATGTSSISLVQGSIPTTMTIPVSSPNFVSGQEHTFTLNAQTENGGTVTNGPLSAACAVMVTF